MPHSDDKETIYRPEAGHYSRQSIFTFAEDVASSLGMEPQREILAAVRKLGGKIVRTKSWNEDEGVLGALDVEPGGESFSIRMPTGGNHKRERFTIAHELGHFFVHYLLRFEGEFKPRFVARRFGREEVEIEANWFALAFLMNGEAFTRTFREHGGNITRLAKEFRVSEIAAQVRAKQCGLIEAVDELPMSHFDNLHYVEIE